MPLCIRMWRAIHACCPWICRYLKSSSASRSGEEERSVGSCDGDRSVSTVTAVVAGGSTAGSGLPRRGREEGAAWMRFLWEVAKEMSSCCSLGLCRWREGSGSSVGRTMEEPDGRFCGRAGFAGDCGSVPENWESRGVPGGRVRSTGARWVVVLEVTSGPDPCSARTLPGCGSGAASLASRVKVSAATTSAERERRVPARTVFIKRKPGTHGMDGARPGWCGDVAFPPGVCGRRYDQSMVGTTGPPSPPVRLTFRLLSIAMPVVPLVSVVDR